MFKKYLLGLTLLFLAACSTPAQVAQTEPAQNCVSAEQVKANMLQHGVTLRTIIKDPALIKKFNEYAAPHMDTPPPEDATTLYFFQKEEVALVVWFKDGCALAHIVAPWNVIHSFLGPEV